MCNFSKKNKEIKLLGAIFFLEMNSNSEILVILFCTTTCDGIQNLIAPSLMS